MKSHPKPGGFLIFDNMQPIGVFDSGYGGLTVLREITARLPQYDYLYLGDNARAPYGDRDFDTVYTFTLEAVQWLFGQGCQLVILACNTASAKALRSIQQRDLPRIDSERRVLGVIRPTAEVIGTYTKTGHVGILGTRGTVRSESYVLEIEKFFPGLKITQEACPSWVSIVEEHRQSEPESLEAVRFHLNRMLDQDPQMDTILLACTHYPLLMPLINRVLPEGIRVLAQGPLVAESLVDYLTRHSEIHQQCSTGGSIRFFTTGSAADFDAHASDFYGKAVQSTALVGGLGAFQ
jgi:glutamate racemase